MALDRLVIHPELAGYRMRCVPPEYVGPASVRITPGVAFIPAVGGLVSFESPIILSAMALTANTFYLPATT